jgi:RNA polymerase sigma-70 factor (ECF subfamily)
MSTDPEEETECLLGRVAEGDELAGQALLQRYRDRLAAMVRYRMDGRVVARFDPSDVIQDAFTEASRKLMDYARTRPIPFYPWLRAIAWERLVQLHRQHLHAQQRSVRREQMSFPLPDESEYLLAERVYNSTLGVSGRAVQREVRARVRAAIEKLPDVSREIIIMRHLEELPFNDITVVLDLSEAAVYSRYRRAIEQLTELLKQEM